MVIATQPGAGRRRQHDLDALAGGERGGEERRFLIDPLAGRVRDELRQPPAPVEIRKRQRLPLPALSGLDERPPGRLMQSSVTSLRESNGRSARSVSSSAEARGRRPQCSFGLEVIIWAASS